MVRTRKFEELRSQMSPESRAESKKRAEELLAAESERKVELDELVQAEEEDKNANKE